MKLNEAIATLQNYNDWRVGKEIPMPEPKKITEAIDAALNILKGLKVPE